MTKKSKNCKADSKQFDYKRYKHRWRRLEHACDNLFTDNKQILYYCEVCFFTSDIKIKVK